MNNSTKPASKWKTWHKVVIGIAIAFFGLMFIAVNSGDSKKQSKSKCAKYEVVFDAKKVKHIFVADLTEADALCISEKLYSNEYRYQTFMFYKFKDDYTKHKWKYEISYNADDSTATVVDGAGRKYEIVDFDKL